jgi:hypothetical protein
VADFAGGERLRHLVIALRFDNVLFGLREEVSHRFDDATCETAATAICDDGVRFLACGDQLFGHFPAGGSSACHDLVVVERGIMVIPRWSAMAWVISARSSAAGS